MFSEKYAHSITFLETNARDVIKYRLHRDILHDIDADTEAAMLEKVMQTADYKLMLTHVKPNGYIGIGMHSWDKFKASYLDDGETAARLLYNYGIPPGSEVVKNFVAALRDDAVLEQEFSYYNPEKVRFVNRSRGINSGSTLDVLIYTMQALLGYGDDAEVRHFVDASYNAFVSLLDINSIDDLTDNNPNLKRRYNYPVISPDTYFPCQYHLETLANTTCWRTAGSVQKLADAVNHHDRILKEGDAFAVKLDGKQVGPAWAFMQPFEELQFPAKSPNQRRTITMLAKATGDLTDVVKRSRDTLERMLEDDGVLRTTFATPYEKKCFKGGLRSAHNYAEVGLEPDHRKDTAIWCELTYWAIDFLYTIENFRK